MGKGIGSFNTTRRVIRSGELLFDISSDSAVLIRHYASYVKARLPALTMCVKSYQQTTSVRSARRPASEALSLSRPS